MWTAGYHADVWLRRLDDAFSGPPYGAFLNRARKLFGLPPGGSKPMSFESSLEFHCEVIFLWVTMPTSYLAISFYVVSSSRSGVIFIF